MTQVLGQAVSNGLLEVEHTGFTRASWLQISLAEGWEAVVAGNGAPLIHPDNLAVFA